MDLTKEQQEGLGIAVYRYKRGEKYSVIAGYAGTGKSTLVQHIIAALGIPELDVVYCAYTGKATLVLSRKGCKNTSTLHKLLYNARLNPKTGTFYFTPRYRLEYPYKIIVVDEVSMLSQEMWQLLLRHDAYVLALGDPGQLGPVKSDIDSGLLKNPHIFLKEIMRQAEGNEIIRLSMAIRAGEPLRDYHGSHVKIIPKEELTTGMLTWADTILCAKNETRHKLNAQVRELLGQGPEPEIGDKIICLKNYWEVLSAEQTPLVNGTIGYIAEIQKSYNPIIKTDVFIISFEDEIEELYSNIMIDAGLLLKNKSSLTKADYVRLTRNEQTRRYIPKEFAFGNAITTWKAQGSEWDNVLLFEESFPWIEEDHRRYLYTGVTRASEKIVVVKK